MKMTFRWYGHGNDTISLHQIKQIPGVDGIVWALHDQPAGEEWTLDRIKEVKEIADEYGLHIDVVESVNIHEDIKLGLPTRDMYIENYQKTIENLAQVGVKVICYNFMPVFDWIRTDLNKEVEDGSTALFYEAAKLRDIDPKALVETIALHSELTMPGWEPERLASLANLFKAYKDVTEDDLWDNLKYFLEQVIPVAQSNDIKMAIHPDDPPWSVFGLPRIITNQINLRRFLKLVDNPYNCITLCTGSLGANPKNDVSSIIREFIDRIPFAHIRNVRSFENGDFIETSHRTSNHSLDMQEIVQAFHENRFNGYVRPDHGRQIWNERCRPGYGLYDRALGIMYLWGIWDTLEKQKKRYLKL